MPYAVHNYFVVRGSLGSSAGGQDIWQFGVRCLNAGTVGGTPPSQAATDKVRSAAVTMITSAGNAGNFSSSVTLDEVRGYTIGADGRAFGPPQISAAPSQTKGAATVNLHPWSTAVAITFDAGGARGGRFGRIYLPPQGISVGPDGRMANSSADGFVNMVKTFLTTGFGVSPGEDYVPVVASARYGTLKPIQQLRCGTVPDTQRRRDNRLAENYRTVQMN